MATKLILRPSPLPFPTLFPRFPLLTTPVHSLLSTSASTPTHRTSTLNLNPNPNLNLSYGPSLHNGRKLSHDHLHHQFHLSEPSSIAKHEDPEEEEKDYIFDESAFTRVFDIAAIRVPSAECFTLENRLRGHLLNWPRIRNIARVPGDEMDEEFSNLVGKACSANENGDDDSGSAVSLNRRLYGKAEGDGELLSPVLYREKLVKTFSSRGFVKFRNLAKLSRPKKKVRKKEEERGGGKKNEIGKKEIVMVEAVEDGELEDLSGLLGEEFKGRRWRGPTRLLLLDERYAASGVDELPEAIKVAKFQYFDTL